jgi:preprotein translocase subunit Sss1
MEIQAHTVKHLLGLLLVGLVFYVIERVMWPAAAALRR